MLLIMNHKNKLCGYVPVLKKEYSFEEIRDMSYFLKDGSVSKLSILVCDLQGIYCSSKGHIYEPSKRIISIPFCFNFECIDSTSAKYNHYIDLIWDVLINIDFFKVIELSEEDLRCKIESSLNSLKWFVSDCSLNQINDEFNLTKKLAAKNKSNISKLRQQCKKRGFKSNHNIFTQKNVSPEIMQKLYERRELSFINFIEF